MISRDSVKRMASAWDKHPRRGVLIVWIALCLIIIMAFVAYSVDLGLMVTCESELQNAADAGSMSGARALRNGRTAAIDTAQIWAEKNSAAGELVSLVPSEDVEIGIWDRDTDSFVPVPASSSTSPNAVRVTCRRQAARGTGLPLSFAPMIGVNSADLSASSVTTLRARDTMLVVDLSGSMNDDGKIKSIPYLGRAVVEQQLLKIWQDMGSPTFGNMGFTTTYVAPSSSSEESSSEESSSKESGGEEGSSSTNYAEVQAALGLDTVTYPFAGSSWNDYIAYVQSNPMLQTFGYDDQYGGLTLIDFWLSQANNSSTRPELWQTQEQPIGAVKSSVQLYCDIVGYSSGDDRVGLVAYSYPDTSGAILESPLTYDVNAVASIMWQRQAGHYSPYTNIGAGIRKARLELETNSRPLSDKVIVMMTDGQANRPTSQSVARQFALDEATLAANAGIKVMCVSLGRGADRNLLDQIAQMTGGVHYNVPPSYKIEEYNTEMLNFYRAIAEDRVPEMVQ
ncbi:MAG: VWA domain-containing protein [Planctomycetaceae bacterium]|nr:VWA domain-containing protein [Planctomycetaceae bacterium]